jgi:hypothetical protein
MTTPGFVRRLRTRFDDAQARHLRAQLAAERARNRALDERLAQLQVANEGAYRDLQTATGGAQFDPAQPFGAIPAAGGTA